MRNCQRETIPILELVTIPEERVNAIEVAITRLNYNVIITIIDFCPNYRPGCPLEVTKQQITSLLDWIKQTLNEEAYFISCNNKAIRPRMPANVDDMFDYNRDLFGSSGKNYH